MNFLKPDAQQVLETEFQMLDAACDAGEATEAMRERRNKLARMMDWYDRGFYLVEGGKDKKQDREAV